MLKLKHLLALEELGYSGECDVAFYDMENFAEDIENNRFSEVIMTSGDGMVNGIGLLIEGIYLVTFPYDSSFE